MVRADVVTIQPGPSAGKDALASQGAPTTNYGSDVSLASGMGPDFGTQEKRAYVQFDLSSIPQGATINSATLSLYVNSTGGGSQTAGAYKITAAWTEGSLNWNNQPAVNGTAESTTTVSSAGWKSWTLTSLVSAWCGGSATNCGVCIKQSSGTSPNNVRFNSSNYTTDASLRPKLVVDYTGGGGGAPTAVTLNNPTNVQSNQMTLTWSQNNDANFQSYKLYRSTTAGVTEASTLVTTQNQQTTTTFTDTALTANTAYYYKVYVVNTSNVSAGSDVSNAGILPLGQNNKRQDPTYSANDSFPGTSYSNSGKGALGPWSPVLFRRAGQAGGSGATLGPKPSRQSWSFILRGLVGCVGHPQWQDLPQDDLL